MTRYSKVTLFTSGIPKKYFSVTDGNVLSITSNGSELLIQTNTGEHVFSGCAWCGSVDETGLTKVCEDRRAKGDESPPEQPANRHKGPRGPKR